MKLGTQTGSIINHLQARRVIGQPEPAVGMGVTMLSWTDRSPGTIFRVFKVGQLTLVEVRADDYKRTDKNGLSEDQSYEYTTKINGYRTVYRREKSGMWSEVRLNEVTGKWNKTGGHGLVLGRREKYHDFSF